MNEVLEKLQKIENNTKLSFKAGLTLEEASTYTGIGRKTLEEAIRLYSVPYSTIGRKKIIYKEYLNELLKAGVEMWEKKELKKKG